MEYKVNIFSLLIIAAILGCGLIDGKAASPGLEKAVGEVNINSKNEIRWEGLLLSHTVSPFKKCFTNWFFERVKPIFLFRTGFGRYLKNFSRPPLVNTVFNHISINAP